MHAISLYRSFKSVRSQKNRYVYQRYNFNMDIPNLCVKGKMASVRLISNVQEHKESHKMIVMVSGVEV